MFDTDCILTTKEISILETMLDRRPRGDDPMTLLLRHKVASAHVVFHDDIPDDVATIGSRVVYSVDGKGSETRVISHDRMNEPVGYYLPVTSMRGLALIGLPAGRTIDLQKRDGGIEKIRLDRILYQPEAARRMRLGTSATPQPPARRAVLRLVGGSDVDRRMAVAGKTGGRDDPGPSAA